jgi:hypothetical protein
MIKLSEPSTSPAGHARGLLDERLPATHRGDGKSARACSQVGAKSRSTVVVSERMAGWHGAS